MNDEIAQALESMAKATETNARYIGALASAVTANAEAIKGLVDSGTDLNRNVGGIKKALDEQVDGMRRSIQAHKDREVKIRGHVEEIRDISNAQVNRP